MSRRKEDQETSGGMLRQKWILSTPVSPAQAWTTWNTFAGSISGVKSCKKNWRKNLSGLFVVSEGSFLGRARYAVALALQGSQSQAFLPRPRAEGHPLLSFPRWQGCGLPPHMPDSPACFSRKLETLSSGFSPPQPLSLGCGTITPFTTCPPQSSSPQIKQAGPAPLHFCVFFQKMHFGSERSIFPEGTF